MRLVSMKRRDAAILLAASRFLLRFERLQKAAAAIAAPLLQKISQSIPPPGL